LIGEVPMTLKIVASLKSSYGNQQQFVWSSPLSLSTSSRLILID
jgi:hypothetical protein